MGFGEHAALSYQELKETVPDYCRWVKATAPESGSIRLVRLARWLGSRRWTASGSRPHGATRRRRPSADPGELFHCSRGEANTGRERLRRS